MLGVELIEVSAKEKLISTLGGGTAMLLLFLLTNWAVPDGGATAIVASMGASAVLLFAAPHGQLSQPWPVIGGHVISAAIGVLCGRYISHPYLAGACAVGLAIGAMCQLKCIHPPGGATALTAVMGGNAIHQLGFGFVWFPVLSNAVVMVMFAVLLNSAFRWRRYPAILTPSPKPAVSSAQVDEGVPTHEEIVAALKSLDSFVDISEEDLVRLTERLTRRTRGQRSASFSEQSVRQNSELGK